MGYCVVDFETTGLSGRADEVIEFAAVRVDAERREIGLYVASLCRPQLRIPARITEITGITDGMVAGYPLFAELLPGLLSFIGDDVFVAHNAPFDLSFLRAYCERGGREFPNAAYCTLSAARRRYPELHSHRLSSVAGHLGVGSDGWHRALGDAMTTAQVFLALQGG